jgi:nucleoid-associated protein YgaU
MKVKCMVFYRVGLCLLMSVAAGCALNTSLRTYTVEKERVDQDFLEGNRGYLTGTPKETAADYNRKKTRKTFVTEIEFGLNDLTEKPQRTGDVDKEDMALQFEEEDFDLMAAAEEDAEEDVVESAVEQEIQEFASYVVKPNDTLQKVSMEFYGTTKKWKRIYEANAAHLKTPDKIYVGQVLKVPRD